MANFTRTKYESDDGTIHAVRISQEKVTLAGTAPLGAVSSGIRAKVSKSNKEYGIRPRGVTIAKEFGIDPDTFQRYTFIPVLTEVTWGTEAYQLNATLNYDGSPWIIIGRVSEDF